MTHSFKKQHYVAVLIALFITAHVARADEASDQDPYKTVFMPDKSSCYQVRYKSSIPLTSAFDGVAIIGNGIPTLIGDTKNEKLTPEMIKASGQTNVAPGIYKIGTELTVTAMPASGLNRVNLVYSASTTKIMSESGKIEQNQDQGLIYVMLRQYTELGKSGINVIMEKIACPAH